MHLQPFEVIANILAILVVAGVVAIHLYGRRRYESDEDSTKRAHYD